MSYQYALNPRYSSPDNKLIDLDVKFEQFPAPIPFTANADDSTDYGRELHARAMAGDFGPIQAYQS
ncbi:hypothetical protein [Allopusillimonas ginsengisoli]|uniref:hypothetical protein n=1 Tax=Allopusillimonas ginsengisoli TaxID=453575 RepID=UPI00101F19B5|nr:hypothetical protein [Allopusillimonas ginsengisoli]TEA78633.1 hypothetical protein ERE07_09560 [Allopusillimonas ginsengisoli]